MKEQLQESIGVSQGRFGALAGVFVPTVLTILGLILFLRMGWVVGQTGLAGTVVIILLANIITLITGLSLSAIATNMFVRTGGAYYMISRTLGLEIGGAIGIPLYLSQAIFVAFYIIGFSEAFTASYPGLEPQFLSTGIVLIFGFLAFVGADFVLRIQLVILAILAGALISLFSGGGAPVSLPLWAPAAATAGFWEVFAVFFPAVTGIMVGVSMSGDLKDPAKDIPRGTLLAIGATCLVYLVTAVWLGTRASTSELLSDYMIMHKLARWPVLILLGIFASTLSSALGSILAAPRTLEALARDRAAPRFLEKRLGSSTEPRVAVIVSTGIALAVISMGDLDFVAPIITMFFLNTYGILNLTAGLESLVGNPSFRPRIKVPWFVSLLGALGCYGAMFLISTPATVMAIIISYGIFVWLGRRSFTQNWGDIRSGFWFTLSRFGLIRLEAQRWDIKNWRPNIVVFTSLQHHYEELLEVGSWLASGRGMVSFFHLLSGEVEELAGRGLRITSAKHTQNYLREQGVAGFAECSVVNDLHQGILAIVQAHGIAGLEPNATLMGWSQEPERQIEQLRLMRQLAVLQKSTIFLDHHPEKGFGRKALIDIWWRGRDRNAELMLLLAHIICQSHPWEGARVRVLRVVPNEEARSGAEKHLTQILEKARVEAEPVVLVNSDPPAPLDSFLSRSSQKTDLVLLGLRIPEEKDLASQAEAINRLLASGGSTLLVRSAETEDVLGTEEQTV
jgi:amino acid transporter